jgi:hypothetical protein
MEKFQEDNIWHAAQDGNLEKVKYWVEQGGKNVDIKDGGT